jgi:hypothetical protein
LPVAVTSAVALEAEGATNCERQANQGHFIELKFDGPFGNFHLALKKVNLFYFAGYP